MRLRSPSRPIFLASLLIVLAAVLSLFVAIPVLSGNAFWVVLIGYIVLLVGIVS